MDDGEDNFEGSKYISISEELDEPYLLRLTINLYASKEICAIFIENSSNFSFSMRSLIYIKKHINVY